MTKANGEIISFQYNNFDKVIKKITTVGNEQTQETFNYDDNQNLVIYTNVKGIKTVFAYDGYDRISSKQTLSASGKQISKTSYEYDAKNRIVSVTVFDASNTKTQSKSVEYSRFDEVVKVTHSIVSGNALKTKTESFTYDANGNILTHSDAKNITTSFEYNTNNQAIKMCLAGICTLMSYDENGNKTQEQVVYSNAQQTNSAYAYNKDNQATNVTQNGTVTKSVKYDVLGNVIELTTPNTKQNFAYDTFGNVIQKVEYDENNTQITTHYEYDSNDLLTKVTPSQGGVIEYVRDAKGRVIEEKHGSRSIFYTYNLFDEITSLTLADGTKINNVYDDLGRLTQRTT